MADVLAALQYASHKLPVFPVHGVDEDGNCTCGSECSSPAKHPRTPNGFHDASTDTAVINEWWEKWPDSNIGLPTGSVSNWFVIDVDLKSGGLESWADLQDQYSSASDTLVSKTGGGGNHYVYQLNGHDIKNSANQLGQGIDIRSEGGYVVVSPSIHASQERYEWLGDLSDIKPVPDWVVEKLSTPGETEEVAAPDPEVVQQWAQSLEEIERLGVGEGRRNQSAYELCKLWVSQSYSLKVIERRLKEWNAKCQPPMDWHRELSATFKSATRHFRQAKAVGIVDPPDYREALNTLYYTYKPGHELNPYPGWSLVVRAEDVGRRTGELKTIIHCDLEHPDHDQWGIAGPLSWTITSSSSRELTSRNLRKADNTVDWDRILYQLARLVDRNDREGRNGLVDLRDYQDRPGSQYALEPLLLEERPSIIFGFGGLGKSMVALAVMASLNSGEIILPGLKPSPGHKGLYLDWESSSWDHGFRYRQLMKGAGLEANDYEMLHLPLAASLDVSKHTIARHIDTQKVSFLVLDSGAMSAGGNPIDIEATNQMFETLRALGLPALIIAHQAKGNERDETPFGSVFWHNNCGSSHQIDKQQSVNDASLSIALLNRKMNNGRLREPLSFQFTFAEDAIYIEATDIQNNPELSKRTRLIDQIRDAVAKSFYYECSACHARVRNADLEDTERAKGLCRGCGSPFMEDGTREYIPMSAQDICKVKEIGIDSGKTTLNRWENRKNGIKRLSMDDPGYRTDVVLYTVLDNETN